MTIEFARLYTVQRGYQDEADDGTAGGGGGDKELDGDRGNELVGDEKDQKDAEAAKAKAEEDAKREADKAAREKDVRIPKERFDEAVSKERKAREQAQREAAELRDKLEKQTSAEDVKKIQDEVDALEELLDKALADNDAAEKKRLRALIREKSDLLTDARVNARSAIATAIAVEQIKYDTLVEKLEADYPFLNIEKGDDFDPELAGELMELKGAYEQTGLGSTAALKKAVSTLGHKLDAKKAPAKGDEDKAAAEKKIKDAEAEAEAKRREAAVGKGQEAKAKIPPSTDKAGVTDKQAKELKATELSDDDFEKLTDAERKRLRGD